MKYSKSAIGLLTAQYRSVLKKCWLINVGLFALGAVAATPANAANINITDNIAYTGASNGAETTTVETHYTSYTDGNAMAAAINTLNGDSSTAGSVAQQISTSTTGMVTTTTIGNGSIGTIQAGTATDKKVVIDGSAGTISIGTNTVATTADIADAIGALDTTASQAASTTNPLALTVTQADGVITDVSGSIATDGTTIAVNSSGKLEVNSITADKVSDFDTQVEHDISSSISTSGMALNTALAGKANADLNNLSTAGQTILTDSANSAISASISSGAIKTALADKINTSDIATTLSTTSTDSQVASAKAVYDGLATKVNNDGNFTAGTDSALIQGKTVVNAIKDTAAAVDVNAAKNTTQDTALTNLYTAVNGGTYNAGTVTGASTLTGFTATNLTAAANELLGDITVTAGQATTTNHLTAGANLAVNVVAVANSLESTEALVGTTSAPVTGTTGILAGKTITGAPGTDNLNIVNAISYVAAHGAGLSTNNVYTGTNTYGSTSGSQVIIGNSGNLTANTGLKVGTSTTNMLTVSSTGTTIGAANAIVGTASSLDMGGNTLTNVKGLTLTDGTDHTNDATISVDANGIKTSSNLTVDGYIKATGIDTSTANTVKLGGTGFTTAVTGDLTVSGDTTLANTSVDGTLDVTGKSTFGNATGSRIELDGGALTVKDSTQAAVATIDNSGNASFNGKLDVDGLASLDGGISVNNKFTVATDGSMSAAGGNFTVTSTGATTMKDKLTVTTGGADITGNTTVKGTFGAGANGTEFQVGSTGNVYAQSLAFNSDKTKMVNAIDQGTAITDGDADATARKQTMATAATVAKTIGKLNDKNAHGVTDVSDVASAISSLSQNVETATGGRFTGATWTGTVSSTKAVSYAAGVNYNTIMSAVDQVASNIGAATTVAFNNVAADNTVNANIDALNKKVGDMNTIGYGYNNLSNGTTTQPRTVVEALQNIDASMGTIHGLAAKLEAAGTYQGNLAQGTTVEQHLTALDSAIGNRANFEKMHYTQGSKTVVDAIGKLDTKLNSVDHDVRTLRHKFQSGMASAAALSALVPNARAHGNTQLSVGTGMYHGHGAMAVGGFHWFTDNILFNTGIAWDDNEATYRMGVTYSW